MIIKNENINKSVLFLWILTLIAVCCISFLRPDGGISIDSLIYFEMSEKLPIVDNNIYPIGFPAILRVINIVFGDYFWTSKFINFFCLAGIGIFSIKKKFYVQPTLILLSFKMFTSILFFSLSEGPFLFFLYLLVYYIYCYFKGKIKSNTFIILGAILFFTLYTIRYTTIFIGVGLGVFYLIYSFKKDKFKTFFKDSFFHFLLLSLALILPYLIISYLYFSDLFGEAARDTPMYTDAFNFTLLNILGSVNMLNPIYSIKFDIIEGSRIYIQVIISLIDLLFLIIGFRLIYKHRSYLKNPFWSCLLWISIMFFICVFVTEYLNHIDPIFTRVIIVPSCFLLFFILVLIYENHPKYIKYAIVIGYASLLFNFIFAVRKPVNYLSYKEYALKALEQKPNALYFYDDNETPVETEYNIPFTNKSIKYVHIYYQPGYINEKILMYAKPGLKTVENINNIDTNLIIFNSDIPHP